MSELTDIAIAEKTLLLELYSSGNLVGLKNIAENYLRIGSEQAGDSHAHKSVGHHKSIGLIWFSRASYISLLMAAHSVGVETTDTQLVNSIDYYVREKTKIPHDGTVRVDLLRNAHNTLLERLYGS